MRYIKLVVVRSGRGPKAAPARTQTVRGVSGANCSHCREDDSKFTIFVTATLQIMLPNEDYLQHRSLPAYLEQRQSYLFGVEIKLTW